MMREVFRVPVSGDARDYKTYSMLAPTSTHHRPATCEEAECGAWARGWVTRVPINSAAEAYILKDRTRRWQETTGAGNIAAAEREFMFAPGQRCFGSHTVPVGREPLYVIRDGDYRGNPTGRRIQVPRAQDWVDDFGAHQARIAEQQERG